MQEQAFSKCTKQFHNWLIIRQGNTKHVYHILKEKAFGSKSGMVQFITYLFFGCAINQE